MPGQEVVARGEGSTQLIRRAFEEFTEEEMKVLAQFMRVPEGTPALRPLVAITLRWGLDPFAGHVYLIKQRDGSFKPAAGRDGYLAIANQQEDFLGVQGDVERDGDTFSVEWVTERDGMRPQVTHAYGLRDAEGKRIARGGIIGAWALCSRRGRLPQYYYAPFSEHKRDAEKTAWSYASAMILKSAYSMALRLTYGITGMVPVDELRSDDLPQVDGGAPGEDTVIDYQGEVETALEAVEDQGLRARLRDALERQPDPYEWSPARIDMMFRGRPEADQEALIKALEKSAPEPEDADVVTPEEEARLLIARHEGALEAINEKLDGIDKDEDRADLVAERDQLLEEVERLRGE